MNINQAHKMDIIYETSSSIKYTEENVWKLMESLQYDQSSHADTINTFTVVFIFIIFVLGIILSIGIFRWYIKKNILIKI